MSPWVLFSRWRQLVGAQFVHSIMHAHLDQINQLNAMKVTKLYQQGCTNAHHV